jgi:predicted Fe-Mo cluster-binding NifX family protein
MVVCLPVMADGSIDPRWGRAQRIAVAQLTAEGIGNWTEFEVGWDTHHDDGTEGAHHARIARFLQDHSVEAVVAGHMGPPMVHMLDRMGVKVILEAAGSARLAAMKAAG